MKLKEIIAACERTYCGSYGVEYIHIPDREQCDWIRDRIEVPQPYKYSIDEKRRVLDRLIWSSSFEAFLAQKYPNDKRFGLEGCETLVPGMKALIDRSVDYGVKDIVIGMPHRGRLNVLSNVVRKPNESIFSEFSGSSTAEDEGSGDVKYHLGMNFERPTPSGKRVQLSLVANPSHLEAEDPVVLGKTRAIQHFNNDEKNHVSAMGVLLHGDAAFAAQGVVYETMGFYALPAYSTGGTIHIVVNNQIGFTTDPRFARSTPYCSDIAKAIDAPALAWFGAAFVWSAATAFVCDEETVLRDGGRRLRSAPVLRQAVDADSLLDANVFGETVAIRAAVYRAVAPGLPEGSVTAARTALLLRLAGTGRVGHVPHPLVSRRDGAPPSAEAHRAGVDAYLAGADLTDRVVRTGDGTPLWRPARPETPVAVLIPTRDNGGDLREMVSSLRATAAVPDALAIVVVDNGTTRSEDLVVLRSLADEPGVRVLRRDGPFNWSALNNAAAATTEAPLLVFANDDMRMVSPRWDERLRGLLERPDVGAVGARLLYDDDTVQHAGVLLGWKGSVIHDGLYAPAADPGPASRWHLTRAVGAVTGAFLALRRDTFAALGGFDAAALPVAYSDIDLCLRLGASGLRVLWTPAITLYHHESKSRGLDHTDGWRAARNAQERAVMEARWGAALDHDPSLNPCWVDATLPFRLIASPSGDAVRRYVEGRTNAGAQGAVVFGEWRDIHRGA